MRNCTSESSDIASPSARAWHLDLADNTDVDKLLGQMTEMIKEIEEYFEHVDHQLPTNQTAYVDLHVGNANKRKSAADESRKQRHKRQKTSPTAEYDESSPSSSSSTVTAGGTTDTAVPNVYLNDRSRMCRMRGQCRAPVPMERRMLTNANLARLFDVVVKRVEKDMIK